MSDHGFHVHGPHDHEIEHAIQHAGEHGHGGSHTLAGRMAVITAVLACIGAFFGYMGGLTQANASLYKNNAAIKKTEAADQWNYYQAKANKQNLSELAAELVTSEEKREAYRAKVARYDKEKAEINAKAGELDKESSEWDAKSDEELHLHHRWAQATTVLQVSIALAAIALLTRKRWMEGATLLAGASGIVLGVLAALHV